MDCPRCGTSLESYRLNDSISYSCPKCAYVGIETEHNPTPRTRESWDDAMRRFRERDAKRDMAAAEAYMDVSELIAELDLPGTGDVLERRRESVALLYEQLRTVGDASKAELLAIVDPEALGYGSEDTFWSNTARKGLAALPGVQPPESGSGRWRFESPEVAEASA